MGLFTVEFRRDDRLLVIKAEFAGWVDCTVEGGGRLDSELHPASPRAVGRPGSAVPRRLALSGLRPGA
jgi:hypothetical protein